MNWRGRGLSRSCEMTESVGTPQCLFNGCNVIRSCINERFLRSSSTSFGSCAFEEESGRCLVKPKCKTWGWHGKMSGQVEYVQNESMTLAGHRICHFELVIFMPVSVDIRPEYLPIDVASREYCRRIIPSNRTYPYHPRRLANLQYDLYTPIIQSSSFDQSFTSHCTARQRDRAPAPYQ